MKKDINRIGMLILIVLFGLFYIITTHLLNKKGITNERITNDNIIKEDVSTEDELLIVNNLYKDARILYDVINNKFTVNQEETITIGNIVYKKIMNFDTIMNNIFTENGINKYINDLGNYFAYTDGSYYLAGNLVSYQTYYFRGDDTNIYITNSTDDMIDAIIYERWTSNNKNTLATIKVINSTGKWLIDEINILSTE